MLSFLLASCGGGADSSSAALLAAPSAVYRLSSATIVGCSNGGIIVYSGVDSNMNGVLDANEITSTQSVCNGGNGINTLVSTAEETAGSHCVVGGTKLSAGLDINRSGLLSANNVTSTAYICNGANGSAGTNGSNGSNGFNSLTTIALEPASTHCANGGSKVTTGLDTNSNGLLDVNEITATAYICNAAAGSTGSAGLSGANGANGAIGAAGTNGASGTNGTNGLNGSNGLNSLMIVAVETAGAHCPNGGSKVTTGLDTNGNGVLDAGEITVTAYICNGATGSTGSNGVNSLVAIAPEAAGTNCTYGGRIITSGLDVNSNNVLDAGEVTSTSYVCNGAIGATGPAGPGITWVDVTATDAVQAVSNTGYIADRYSQVTVTLPTNPSIGDIIQVVGAASRINSLRDIPDQGGSWKIAQNTGQMIYTNNIKNSATTNSFFIPHAARRNWSSLASSSDGMKLVATESGGLIYTSTDSGVSWASHESVRNWSGVASSSDGAKLVAIVNGGQIYTSVDSGFIWTARETPRAWSSVVSSSDGMKLVATVSGGLIYTSTNSGVSWASHESVRNWSSLASSSDGTKLFAIADSEVYRSIDSGATWVLPSRPVVYKDSIASSGDGSQLVATWLDYSQSVNVYTSTDSGLSWTLRYTFLGSFPNRYYSTSSYDGKNLAVINGAGFFIYSVDSGASWTYTDTRNEDSGYDVSIASSADGSKIVYAFTNQNIFTSGMATTKGITGSISGNALDSIELVYIGNGEFVVPFPVNYLLVN